MSYRSNKISLNCILIGNVQYNIQVWSKQNKTPKNIIARVYLPNTINKS